MNSTTKSLPRHDPHEVAAVNILVQIFSLVSISVLIFVLFSYSFLSYRQPREMDRTSLRLVVFASLVYILQAGAELACTIIKSDQTRACRYVAWMEIFTALYCLFLTTAIAINLNLVILLEVVIKHIEWAYYLFFALVALFFSGIGWWFDLYGWNGYKERCYFLEFSSVKNTTPFKSITWGTYYIWTAIAMLYCTVVVFLVFKRTLGEKIKPVPKSKGVFYSMKEQSFTEKRVVPAEEVSVIINRICVYPMIPIFAQVMAFVDAVLEINGVSSKLYAVTGLISSLQGLLFFFAYLNDPTVMGSFYMYRKHAIHTYEKLEVKQGLWCWYVERFLLKQEERANALAQTQISSTAIRSSMYSWVGIDMSGPLPEESKSEYIGRMALEFF